MRAISARRGWSTLGEAIDAVEDEDGLVDAAFVGVDGGFELAALDEDLQRLVDGGRISIETARKFAKESDGITPPGKRTPA